MEAVKHLYEVRPRSDKRGVDLISDVLPFGRLSKCEGGVLASGGTRRNTGRDASQSPGTITT
jgi:hypothetical protein